ncbi:MAG: glucose-1-phosphate adenylyltransferase subunit GlgD [Ruminococcaceae bacterium]|nr:glucose-1-phosphate adenylyltransferase subunit GlgD [Oscillospiraceae bacterium]
MTVAGLVFSNVYDGALPELTARRTMAAVPFGGRYRLFDFALSNMVNSGISRVGVITHNNYHSLLGHIGNGKDWDMSRRSGGIKILPPLVRAYENGGANILPTTRLEALEGVIGFIASSAEENILFSDCDTVCNIDLRELFEAHRRSGAGATVLIKKMTIKERLGSGQRYFCEVGEDGFLTDVYAAGRGSFSGDLLTDIIIFKKDYLLSELSRAISHGGRDFYRDVLAVSVENGQVFSHRFEGTLMRISSLEDYFDHSMSLLEKEVRDSLFCNLSRPILTKVRNSPPTVYKEGSSVKNSYIADGCTIEGSVENSIIFRGVKISRGASVRNCVIMQDSVIGRNAELCYAISDKDVAVRDGRKLFGYKSVPLFMPKGANI